MRRKKIFFFFQNISFLISFFLLLGTTCPSFAWVNPGFETGDLTGWTAVTGSSFTVACLPSVSVVPAGPAINTTVGQLNDIHSGNYAVQLFSGRGDLNHLDWAQVYQTDTVPAAGTGTGCLSFWFAGVFENYHYSLGDLTGDAYLQINVIVSGTTVATLNYNWANNLSQIVVDGLTDNGNYAPCTSADSFQWGYVPWTNYTVNLSAYAGQPVELQATMYDCDGSGHYGVGYLDDVSWVSCPAPQFTLSKSSSPVGTAALGSPVTYTMSYANNGTAGIAGVEINDTIPTGTFLMPGSITSNPTIPNTGQVGNDLIWEIGYLAPGATGTLGFQVMPSTCGQAITNVAQETDFDGETIASNQVVNVVPACTNTPTNTLVGTATNTPTMTLTNTIANTSTATSTDTITNTATVTSTDTVTNTPTNTATVTLTNTVTNTFTVTCTNTITETETNTSTSTLTNTVTNTPTVTVTNTLTQTATMTVTHTSTNTATATATLTPSNTATETFTPTSYVGMGKNVSKTLANAGDTLTYTIGVTVIQQSLTGAVITDTLPASMNFVSFGAVPNGVVTSFNVATDQLQWILPSPLLPNVYNFTYQTQLQSFVPASAPLTNFAQFTYGGAVKPLTSSVPVTVQGDVTVTINIYNSAGEVIKTLLVERFTEPINNVTLTTNAITTLQGPGSTIEILYNGYLLATWDGTDNQNQPVSNGDYQIHIDNANPGGVETSVAQVAIVNRKLASVSASVYNSAGEVIRTLYNLVDDSTGSTMSDVDLSTNAIKPSSTTETSGIPSQVAIAIQTSGSPVTLIWDGSNNNTTFVSPGVYTIAVHWNDDGHTETITREVVVLPGYSAGGTILAMPNVLNATNGMTTVFDATTVPSAYFIQVRLFTLAGERVQTLSSPYGLPQVSWNATGMASGIYLAIVTVQNAQGGTVGVQHLKVLVIH